MSMHPELTSTIYVIIAIIFAGFLVTLVLYTRRMNLKKTAMDLKGRPPLNESEGILLATREKEGRSGPPKP